MSGTLGAGSSYRVLLADRPLRQAFLVSLAGRFGYALLPLCLLFTISAASGSFALAATSTAVFGVCGLVMPVQARLIDRLGQRRVLPVVGSWFAGFLALVAVLGAAQVSAASVWIGLCLVGGLGAPSLGPSMRAQWREATDVHTRSAAYSLDATAEEVLWLLGPLAASGVLLAGPAWWGVAASAVLIPVGVAALVASPYVPAARRTTAGRAWSGPFGQPGFRRLVLVVAAAGCASSAALTLLAAEADRTGRPWVLGLVEAATGVASVLGALWWGRRSPGGPWPRQLAALLAARVVPVAVCVAHPTLWTIAVAFAVTGFVVAPTYVVAFTASDHESDPHHHTEASTWVTSSGNIGTSLGTAAAAWLFLHVELGAAFALVGALVLAAVGTAALTRERRS